MFGAIFVKHFKRFQNVKKRRKKKKENGLLSRFKLSAHIAAVEFLASLLNMCNNAGRQHFNKVGVEKPQTNVLVNHFVRLFRHATV